MKKHTNIVDSKYKTKKVINNTNQIIYKNKNKNNLKPDYTNNKKKQDINKNLTFKQKEINRLEELKKDKEKKSKINKDMIREKEYKDIRVKKRKQSLFSSSSVISLLKNYKYKNVKNIELDYYLQKCYMSSKEVRHKYRHLINNLLNRGVYLKSNKFLSLNKDKEKEKERNNVNFNKKIDKNN